MMIFYCCLIIYYKTYLSHLLPLSFLSFFAPAFPFFCFCPGVAFFWSWAVWTFSMTEKQSSSVSMLLALLLGVDGLERALLGLARFEEHIAPSLGTKFKFRDKGLPGTELRGITRLSPGAPTVRKTSGNGPRCSMFLCPLAQSRRKRVSSRSSGGCASTHQLSQSAHTLWCSLPFVGWSSWIPSRSSGNKVQIQSSRHDIRTSGSKKLGTPGCVVCRWCARVFTCVWEFCILWCSVSGVKEADLGIGLGEPHSPQDPRGRVGGLDSCLLVTVGVHSATTTCGGETLEWFNTRRSGLCNLELCACWFSKQLRPHQCWRTTSCTIVFATATTINNHHNSTNNNNNNNTQGTFQGT